MNWICHMIVSLIDHAVPVPAVKEWFVFPGNKLKEPKMVSPKQFSDSGTKVAPQHVETLQYSTSHNTCYFFTSGKGSHQLS